MNEDRHCSIVKSLRTAGRVLGIVLFAAVVASWIVWGASGLVFYVDGLCSITRR
jgi:hypothetical protein